MATGLREVTIKGFPVWIITVTLRYDKGDEGYIGDLVYDGEKFTFLTEQSVMDERARKIADNPVFRRAYLGLGGRCVVCSKPESENRYPSGSWRTQVRIPNP